MSFLSDLLSVKKTAGDASARLQELRNKGDNVRARIAVVQSAPAAKTDVEAAISSWVDDMSAGFAGSVQSSLRDIIHSPRDVTYPKAFGPRFASAVSRSISAGGSSASVHTEQRDDSQLRFLCALFGPQMKTALLNAVAEMSWDEGLPMAERPAELEKLNAQLDRLNAETSELRQAAKEAGLQLK